MIVVDCLRADRCVADGNPLNLQFWPQVRSAGTMFSQMITTATMTPPSFTSLLTGEYTFVHGIRSIDFDRSISSDLPTLPGQLRSDGYTTYGKFTGPMLATIGLDKDFDDYERRNPTGHKGVPGDTLYSEWGDKLISDMAAGAFKEPWFMLLHLFEVHTPLQFNGATPPRDKAGQFDLAWQQLDKRIAELSASVPENTMTILTADHGEVYQRRADRTLMGYLGSKLRRNLKMKFKTGDRKKHGFHVFDELVRIPFSISGPGVPEGKVINQQVRQIDIMPTILELQGIECPDNMHGRSLVPMMNGQDMEDVPAYVESGCKAAVRHWHGLRTEQWKYAEHPRSCELSDLQPELFNLVDDPGELRNVIADNPKIAAKMRQEIDKLIYSVSDKPQDQAVPLSKESQAELETQLKALGYL